MRIDEWAEIVYPELTDEENETIREARRKGFANFYPAFPDAMTQSLKTLEGAESFLGKSRPKKSRIRKLIESPTL